MRDLVWSAGSGRFGRRSADWADLWACGQWAALRGQTQTPRGGGARHGGTQGLGSARKKYISFFHYENACNLYIKLEKLKFGIFTASVKNQLGVLAIDIEFGKTKVHQPNKKNNIHGYSTIGW